YGLITGIIGNGFAILWFWLFLAQLIPMDRIPFQHNLSIVRLIIPLPFQLGISMFVVSAIIHLCLMLVGGNKHGYKTTFRSVCYSYSARLFNIVPFIGGIIGFIYRIILYIFGVREGHGIRTGKAVLAVLLPLIVIFALITVAIVLAVMFVGSAGLLGGIRT
ncbi:MAG TPA: YIP1 family protein, partial [Thermodesulfobacteriota bacterium]|nr:YIP1 family protein [Thermodesulfobacteriota bacterium]